LATDRVADERTIDAVLAGDREAFGDLVARHGQRMHGAIFRMIGDREAAADLAQETFLKAFTRLDSFRRGSAFYTWLYSIAVNQVRSEFRRRKTKKGSPMVSLDNRTGERDEGHALDPVSGNPGPDHDAQRNEDTVRVHEELARLDEEYREAVVLRDLQGLSYDEVAEATGVPVGTVRSRIHRGRKMLRERLMAPRRESGA
jgi:RNA polymerase sigma-70 factor (ECF subfamily)